MTTFKANPVDLVERILVESAGCSLKIEISPYASSLRCRPGDVYESRIADKKIGEIYALAVYESGSIDTSHRLYLVNLKERVAAIVKWHTVSSPSCFWGQIEIMELKEEGDVAIIKYRISKTSYHKEEVFEERLVLHAIKEVEVEERFVAELTKL